MGERKTAEVPLDVLEAVLTALAGARDDGLANLEMRRAAAGARGRLNVYLQFAQDKVAA
jgi:hypothetical protein